MSDAIANLRALALSRASIPHPVHLVLDDELRAELEQARADLAYLQQQRDKMQQAGDLPPAVPASLADDAPEPVADIDRMIAKAAEVVAAIEDEARNSGSVLVLNFVRLAPAEYQVLVDTHERKARQAAKEDRELNENAVFTRGLGDALLTRCYTGAASLDGDDADLTLDDLRASVLNHADLQAVRQHCVAINRTGQAVPFSPRNSGAPATA